MAYQSLYRRYRPQRFSEVRGQDHLVRALRNAVVEGRVGHAYLFSGPRGTGKTSTARILAKVLNCENATDGEPCGVCDSCLAIEHGSSFDVFELDAASNNGVSDIRALVERANLGSPGRTKVYILDEVHMLTAGASNALLKTLEEPPDHVVFVLATTDPQKVLPTIQSRTQHFQVHLLSGDELRALVEHVVEDAGLDVTPEAIAYVVRAGAGSARDTLSALDQVVAAGGIPEDDDAIDELVEALCEKDTGRALLAVEQAMGKGSTPRILGENLIDRLRDVFLAAMKTDIARLTERDQALVQDWAQRMGAAAATRALEVLGDAFVRIADAPDPRIPLEVALVRLTKPEADHSLEVIVERLERLERGLGPLGTPPPPAPHTGAHPHVDAVIQESEPQEDPGDDDDAPPPPSRTGGAADVARQALAERRAASGAGPARGAKKAAASPPAKRAPTKRVPPTSAAARESAAGTAPGEGAPAPRPKPATPTAAAAVPSADGAPLPSRDDLTIDWADKILPTLPQRVRARYAAGRFISSEGNAVRYGLPNATHVSRAADLQAEVEAALAQHYGRPVPLELVVDDDASAADPSQPRYVSRGAPSGGSAAPEADPEEAIDPADLVDAGEASTTTVDRIATIFPGVEVVDEP